MNDIVIVGAGCAGLSLAYALVERGVDRSIVLVDPRTRYERDRTWCFFGGEPHPFADLVTSRWPRWRVRARGRWIERSAPGITYEHLPADAFYQRCLKRLKGRVDLRLGVRAGALREDDDGVHIDTDAGPIRARIAFDSRPAPATPSRADITLLQHFEGWHIQTDQAAFDPGVATLMDFAVPQDHAIHFVYVLPYSPYEALVEATWFGGQILDDQNYRRAIERYLRGQLRLDRWSVLRRERGVIPMSTVDTPARIGRRIYRIGLGGGMAKPSTGYAFLAIQRYSAAMAERLAHEHRAHEHRTDEHRTDEHRAHEHRADDRGADDRGADTRSDESLPEPPELRPWRARTLDAIFLSYLARHQERAPDTFATLFDRVDPALLVRFLSDRASPLECLRVMRALPMAPFTLETARARRLWLR